MIELAKHIEVLLLENDCVIVPGLGGFIAHNRQAEFKESEDLFCSPVRTIGFNPQLVMNDGLLVQTYMQAYNTDFPDATRKIEKIVSALKEQLYRTGEVWLPNVGTLYYTMKGTYVFEPSTDTFFTPYLYGLSNLSLSPLQVKEKEEKRTIIHPFVHTENDKREQVYAGSDSKKGRRTLQRLAQHTVGIAAAILLFFLLSVPVENTYMDDASYASLSAESMFDAIRGRSAATNLLCDEVDAEQVPVKRTKNNVNTLKPVRVVSQTVEAAPEKDKANDHKAKAVTEKGSKKTIQSPEANKANVSTAPAKPVAKKETAKANDGQKVAKEQKVVQTAKTTNYHIIVASLPKLTDAQKQLKDLQNKGFTTASILNTDNRHRISLFHFDDSGEAYKKLKELRKQEDYKPAWVFTVK